MPKGSASQRLQHVRDLGAEAEITELSLTQSNECTNFDIALKSRFIYLLGTLVDFRYDAKKLVHLPVFGTLVDPGNRNLIKKPWAYNPQIVGFIQGTLKKAQGFFIRFPFWGFIFSIL